MLKKLEVWNFGKHRHKVINFTEGLNIVRGQNEGGKSTIGIEAPAYAFFGSPMLRETIEDTVTTGEPVGSLKVQIHYGDYVVTRSKNSANVVGNGKKIAGQNEVSDFFRDLFGIKKGTERSVLVAEQGEVQGVISAKGNATAIKFIEDLAGFDQIDSLIDKLKIKYPSGDVEMLESLLEEYCVTKQQLDKVTFPDLKEKERQKHELETLLMVQNSCVEQDQDHITDFLTRIAKTEAAIALKKAKETEISNVTSRLEALNISLLNTLQELKAIDRSKLGTEAELNETIDSAAAANKLVSVYNFITKLNYDGDVWDEPLPSLQAKISETNKKLNALIKTEAQINTDTAQQARRIDNKETCNECGQSVVHLHEEINNDARRRIDALGKELKKTRQERKEVEEYLTILSGILAYDQQLSRDLDTVLQQVHECQNCSIDFSIVPRTVTWTGPVPQPVSNEALKTLREELTGISVTKTKIKNLEDKVSQINRDSDKDLAYKKKLTAEWEAIKIPELKIEFLKEEIAKLQAAITENKSFIATKQAELSSITAEIATTTEAIKNHQLEVKRIEERITSTTAKIKEDKYNSSLLKSVREARPAVINKVWEVLLIATSQYFASIRGESCEMTRDGKSFIIGGMKSGRLSGSTLDALGLSLRASTAEIFAPSIDFMLIDEPFGAMDLDRSAAAIAMVAGLPMPQVILVTHEETSDSMADNLIEV